MKLRISAGSSGLWRRPVRTLIAIWLAVSAALAVFGPFGSFVEMTLSERAIYWGAVVGVAIALVTALRLAAVMVLGKERSPFLIDAVVTPPMVLLFAPPLYHFNEDMTGGTQPFSLIETGLIVLAVTGVLIALREVLGLHAPGVRLPRMAEGQAATVEVPATLSLPPLVERLPDMLRGEVMLVSSADHYVEIRTPRGQASILLRFADALRELGDHPGMQVHRSHWVADAAVARIAREGGRWVVVMRCGTKVPVSRSQVEAVQARWGGLSA